MDQKRHGWNEAEEYRGEYREYITERVHSPASTREAWRSRRPSVSVCNYRCLEIAKFTIQD